MSQPLRMRARNRPLSFRVAAGEPGTAIDADDAREAAPPVRAHPPPPGQGNRISVETVKAVLRELEPEARKSEPVSTIGVKRRSEIAFQCHMRLPCPPGEGEARRPSRASGHVQRLWVPDSPAATRNDSGGGTPTALMLRSPRSGRLEARGRLPGARETLRDAACGLLLRMRGKVEPDCRGGTAGSRTRRSNRRRRLGSRSQAPGARADAARRTGIIRLVPQREEPHRTRTFFGHTRGALCDTLASWDAI